MAKYDHKRKINVAFEKATYEWICKSAEKFSCHNTSIVRQCVKFTMDYQKRALKNEKERDLAMNYPLLAMNMVKE